MEWPKRARTVNWESGVLTLDGEKQFEVPELTTEIMEQLAAYTLVGFHVKGYPVTDELLVPFAGHKSMEMCIRDRADTVELLNGERMPWEQVKRDGIDYIALYYVNEKGKPVQILDAELA